LVNIYLITEKAHCRASYSLLCRAAAAAAADDDDDDDDDVTAAGLSRS